MQQKVVALGGGHGLAATLTALRKITPEITAIVTVADNGGSSGRLRREYPILPPGDLRMALAALCGDDEWGREWARIMQHRFTGEGSLNGHAVGNLLLAALWDRDADPVVGLDRVASLLKVIGRVLPMASEPLDIEGTFLTSEGRQVIRGQAEVATALGKLESLRIIPQDPPAREEALSAIAQAAWVTMGPGSWFSSVLPHLLVPMQRRALCDSSAKKIIVLNLDATPESTGGEFAGYSPEEHLGLISKYAPELRTDIVLADTSVVNDKSLLMRRVKKMGGRLVVADLRKGLGSVHHDVDKLALQFGHIMSNSLIG
ncbi:MAG: uridine diphosphate-N-acetylglucosamine-binding protein YvcK [Actinobacteria bacterium]|nr:uridine diphosphate-N-acetylglucosamine-binding protein YvcK [Actinomycetota bacterium]